MFESMHGVLGGSWASFASSAFVVVFAELMMAWSDLDSVRMLGIVGEYAGDAERHSSLFLVISQCLHRVCELLELVDGLHRAVAEGLRLMRFGDLDVQGFNVVAGDQILVAHVQDGWRDPSKTLETVVYSWVFFGHDS
ncbi:hypothetical protein L7F22_068515, partial [Adiantum nelumboides]|nr:hypothetical protein [Adiantum nelumboides]